MRQMFQTSKHRRSAEHGLAFSCRRNLRSALLVLLCALAWPLTAAENYPDGRPTATLRYNAHDYGIVLHYGGCPGGCDKYGARDAWVFEWKRRFYMHYDAAGSTGWLTALATSSDLVHWRKQGTALKLGEGGSANGAAACSGTAYL